VQECRVCFCTWCRSYGPWLLLGHLVGDHAARCTWEHTLIRSTEDLWNAMLSIMTQVPERDPSQELKSQSIDPSMHPPCRAIAHALLEAVAARTEFRVQGLFSIHTRETGASASISDERNRAAGVECNNVDDRKQSRICLQNGIEYST